MQLNGPPINISCSDDFKLSNAIADALIRLINQYPSIACALTPKAIKAVLNGLYVGGDSLATIYASEDAMESLEFAVVKLLQVQQTVIKKN